LKANNRAPGRHDGFSTRLFRSSNASRLPSTCGSGVHRRCLPSQVWTRSRPDLRASQPCGANLAPASDAHYRFSCSLRSRRMKGEHSSGSHYGFAALGRQRNARSWTIGASGSAKSFGSNRHELDAIVDPGCPLDTSCDLNVTGMRTSLG